MYDINIVGTGSTGNLNIIDDVIAIDCGLPAKTFKPFAEKVEYVMISHEHSDHLNVPSLNYLAKHRPSIIKYRLLVNAGTFARIAKKSPTVASLISESNIIDGNVTRELKTSRGVYQLQTYPLYHNVENQGFVLTNEAGERLIHATDTTTVKDAPEGKYDYFLVEGNYDEEAVDAILSDTTGKYSDTQLLRASQNLRHLSNQQCHQFILTHANPGAQAWQLHESEAFGMKVDMGLGGLATLVEF